VLAGLAVAGSAAVAQEKTPAPKPSSDETMPEKAPTAVPPSSAASEASPLSLLADLERAWDEDNLDAVLACLSSEGMDLALERCGGPPSGKFAPAQAQFLIRDLLHYGETVEFRIVSFEWRGTSPPQARAEWVHRMGSGENRADLEFSLASEAGGWRVVRIAGR
jgi:hypothetical protein